MQRKPVCRFEQEQGTACCKSAKIFKKEKGQAPGLETQAFILCHAD